MIRSPKPSDQGYVASTWKKSIMRGTHAWERHRDSRSSLQLNELIDQVLDRKDTRLLLRVKPHDQDAIQGWVLFVDGPAVPVVYYCYVRADERNKGFSYELLHQVGVRQDAAVVCLSDGPDKLAMMTRYPLATYMPLAEFLKPTKVS